MPAADVPLHQLFDDALRALREGRPAAAFGTCETLLRHAPDTPEVHHLAGLALSAMGRGDEAAEHYEAALRKRPNDPAILSGLAANSLACGDAAGAAQLYREALAAQPAFHDALVGQAWACQRAGWLIEASEAAHRAVLYHPGSARAWQAAASVERDLGDMRAATTSLDRALALAPDDSRIAIARAQLESEMGQDAAPFYSKAAELAPDDPNVAIGLARAELLNGDATAAVTRLDARLKRDPLWIDGHQALARLRWQLGEASDSSRSLDEAIAVLPKSWELHSARILLLQASQQWHASLAAIEEARDEFRASKAHLDILLQMEMVSRDEVAEHDRAAELLAQIKIEDSSLNFQLAVVRHWLRTAQVDRAAALSEPLARSSGHGAAWAYAAAAWRQLGDPRWEWLEGNERFVMTADLSQVVDLDELAVTLRALHKTRANPFDQSLRGGTQTDGQLFMLADQRIQQLKDACRTAVEGYIAQLPPFDATHPLLGRIVGRFRFSGSWSVRLTDGGYHISHIHPEGWISSAFYVSLPDVSGGDPLKAGWLHLGEPPRELGLGLGPVREVEPRRGTLVLFPAYMWHGTHPFGAGERLTAAFDIAPLT